MKNLYSLFIVAALMLGLFDDSHASESCALVADLSEWRNQYCVWYVGQNTSSTDTRDVRVRALDRCNDEERFLYESLGVSECEEKREYLTKSCGLFNATAADRESCVEEMYLSPGRLIVYVQPERPESRKYCGAVAVEVKYTVTVDGTVRDPEVVSAGQPRVFEKAALRAVRQFKYKPQSRGLRPEEFVEARTIQFERSDSDWCKDNQSAS